MAEEKKTTTTKKKPEPAVVIYESREKEPRQFDVAGIPSIRNYNTGRLEFEVPKDEVERFEQHFHVQRQRIVRKATR